MADIEAYRELKNKRRNSIIKRTYIICFLFIMVAHFFDLLTTLIGLKLGAIETNPISAFLFTFGFFGWITVIGWTVTGIMISFVFIERIKWVYGKIIYSEMPISLHVFLYLLFSSTLFISFIYAAVNNILVILKILN